MTERIICERRVSWDVDRHFAQSVPSPRDIWKSLLVQSERGLQAAGLVSAFKVLKSLFVF